MQESPLKKIKRHLTTSLYKVKLKNYYEKKNWLSKIEENRLFVILRKFYQHIFYCMFCLDFSVKINAL